MYQFLTATILSSHCLTDGVGSHRRTIRHDIGLGLNTHIFEFDCFFAHEATFNGRSAVGLGVFSLTILQQQIIAGFHQLV